MPMNIDLEELREHWKRLENSFQLLENRSLLMKPREFRKLVADIGAFSDQMKAMKHFIEGAESGDSTPAKDKAAEPDAKGQQAFEGFFSDLGKGLVETQKNLDRYSEEYLSEVKHKKYLQPTVFRVPKISGELKVAIDQEKNKGLHLMLYSQRSKSRDLREQTLNFEMVGAPMPPGTFPDLDHSIPGLDWVLSQVERQEIAATIVACLDGRSGSFEGKLPNPVEAKRHATEALTETPAELLIFKVDPQRFWLLATLYHLPRPDGQDERFLGVWRLNPPLEATPDSKAVPAKLVQIWKCKQSAAPNKVSDFDRLAPSVEAMIQQQIAFFTSIQTGA